MMEKERTYIAIDLKSFYASVECKERNRDPLTTNLVVADKSRTEKTICLAVSPALKCYGIPGRARLFEVVQKVKEANSARRWKALNRTFIGSSDDSEEALIKSLKDDYIVRAKAVSYIIDAKSEVEYDVDELQKIAALISVDEIHLFDTKGYIYSGSVPKYFGYSFDSGEQMAYFKPMLKDKKLTMCQDVTPNTSEAKEMMYAITWNEAGNKMI